ncbi:MAG: carbohydrate-binding family 9-like protein [Verrucomicrobiota bacterium]
MYQPFPIPFKWLAFVLCLFKLSCAKSSALEVVSVDDFEIDGKGTHPAWLDTEWVQLTKRTKSGHSLPTKAKLLYSAKGLYFLFHCGDEKIISTFKEDFAELYREDVVEVFIQPDPKGNDPAVYLEYEISPRNQELVILVPNYNGKFHGWRPWRYREERETRHQTHIHKEEGNVTAWTAEFFIPFALMKPLPHVPPKPGNVWKMNLYRIDHDSGERAYWSWKPFEKSFHEYLRFGDVQFK